jgi:UDP-GlcNAc:undecaprenyl-phosphate/decaprenyl-phosphate GlcNAc-1-phosphate transferase
VSSGAVPLNWYAVLLVVAALSSWVLTFPARHLALQIGYVAQPDQRKIHQQVTPESGGAAIFVAMLVTWAVAATIPALDLLFHGSSEPLGLILGATAIFVVGIIDDFRDMSAPAKVAGQVLAACILSFLGVTWYQFKIPLAGVVQISPVWAPLLTSLWVIAITNAVNLIDGLDGLAAGVVAIASGALAVYGLHLQALGNLPADNIGPLIAIITCGICLGFLPHNFHPAKIFMGDSGSMLIGLMLAAASTTAAGPISQNAYGARDVFALLSPFLLVVAVMLWPILDLLLAIVRRTRAGRSAFSPDKMHLHHRLLQIGHSHRRVVLLIYLWVGIVAFGAASTIFFNPRDTGAVMLGAIVIAGVATTIPLMRRRDDYYDTD